MILKEILRELDLEIIRCDQAPILQPPPQAAYLIGRQ
jgi:hypothetical protein